MLDIIKAYNEVFDENGDIKSFEIDKYRKLIIECEKYSDLCKAHNTDEKNFGDRDKGILEVKNIKNLIILEDLFLASELLDAYNEVFDESGEIKLCGREKCKKLIKTCMKYSLNRYGEIKDFGNKNNGMMKPENIKNFLYDEFLY